MTFTPEQYSIKKLLLSKKQFIIPRFQREFSWEKVNYDEFFDDLLSNIQFKGGKAVTKPYFLGTMLFVGDFNDSNSDNVEVIDGQQRLTSITILFSAISDIFKENNKTDLANNIFEYIVFTNDDNEKKALLKTKTSYPYFADFIQNKDKNTTIKLEKDNIEELAIENAYKYFIKHLKYKYLLERVECFKDLSYIDVLKIIRDQVLNCTIISITTKDKKEGSKLFEILNAKGKPLAQMDLIKNKIFSELDSTEPSDHAYDIWKTIKMNLSVNNEIVSFEDFFRHYWTSTRGRIRKNDLYDKFKIIKSNEYMKLLIDLLDNSKYYNSIIENKNVSKNKLWKYNSIEIFNKYFNLIQIRPVLLSLYSIEKDKLISNRNLKRIYNILVDFHFVYTLLMHKTSNKLESIYSEFAIQLRKVTSKNKFDKIINDHLIRKIKPLMPLKDDFIKMFVNVEYSSKENIKTNMAAKFIVFRMNSFYSDSDVFDIKGSIEHIVNENIEDKKTLNIGNLILLEEKINNKCGNKDFANKLPFYKKSEYKQIKNFIKKYSKFEKKCIDKRANFLAELFYDKLISF